MALGIGIQIGLAIMSVSYPADDWVDENGTPWVDENNVIWRTD
jgi:hypothetical protein